MPSGNSRIIEQEIYREGVDNWNYIAQNLFAKDARVI